jgi:hypothetical protein
LVHKIGTQYIETEIINDYKLNKLISIKQQLIDQQQKQQLYLILVHNQNDFLAFRAKIIKFI